MTQNLVILLKYFKVSEITSRDKFEIQEVSSVEYLVDLLSLIWRRFKLQRGQSICSVGTKQER